MDTYSFLYKNIKISKKHDTNYHGDAGDDHCHQFVEMLYLTEGEIHFVIETNRFKVSPGDIVIVMPSQYHYVEANNNAPYSRYVIKLDTDAFPDYCIQLLSSFAPHFSIRSQETVAHFSKIDSFAKHYQEDNLETLLYASIIQLIVFLRQDAMRTHFETTSVNIRFSTILEYIDSHLEEDLSLDALSNRFFQSKTWLYNAFKKGVGSSPAEYISSKRISYAHHLIVNGEKPTAVYERCGYRDYSSFYRAYTAKIHQIPSAESNFNTLIKNDR